MTANTQHTLNLLVIGAGGNVSQGIIKALRQSALPSRIVAACVDPMGAGLYFADAAYLCPYAVAGGFRPWLLDVCRSERIDAVLSGNEIVLAELAAFASELQTATNARIISSSPKQLRICRDKLATAEWLAEHNLAAPQTADVTDLGGIRQLTESLGFPLLGKPRLGRGGYGIEIIHDAQALERLRRQQDYVVQEYLPEFGGEFTVGCFCDRNGKARGSIIFQRNLQHGTTLNAVAGDHLAVREAALTIAETLRPAGPINMQFRLRDDGIPVCFEINLRFSGTTPIRARMGFDEIGATLRHYVLDEAVQDLPIIEQGAALRYWNEVYVEPQGIERLQAQGRLDDPTAYLCAQEDFGAG